MYDQVVETQHITVTNVPCQDGAAQFPKVSFDYEEYGEATLSNGAPKPVIVILPYFLGRAKAAGHGGYDSSGKPTGVGYWNGLIGPGAALNTDTHRVISFGPLVNKDSGPQVIDPSTQAPYGSRFPNFSFRDYAAIHRQALKQLGVEQIDVLAGASMGSLQAWHLMAQDPTKVNRMLLVVPGGLMLPNKTRALAAKWIAALEADPNWNQGDYYGLPVAQRPTAHHRVLAEFWYRCQFPLDERVLVEPDQEDWARIVKQLSLLVPEIKMDSPLIDEQLRKVMGSEEPAAKRFQQQLGGLIKVTDFNDLLWQLRTVGTFAAGSALQETDDLRFGWMGDQPIDDTVPSGHAMPKVLIIYAPDDDIFTVEKIMKTQAAPLGLGPNVSIRPLNTLAPHAAGLNSKPMEGLNQTIGAWFRSSKL
jgi:homoserine acetyltransferase